MRDGDEDVDHDNEDTKDFYDYDLNNYDYREDEDPQNNVNSNLAIRTEKNMVDENEKSADNDSDHIQEKEDLLGTTSPEHLQS